MDAEYPNKVDTVILGAGISGLYLALLLERAGQRVVVLEKEDEAGGLLRTVHHEGFRFDLGGHRLVFTDPSDLFSFLQEIGFEPGVFKHQRKARIMVGGKLLHYPPGLADVLRFPPELWWPAAWDFLTGRWRYPSPKTFEEWLCRHYGETIYKLIFKDYTRKVWGVECSSFSAQFLEQRVGRFHWREFLLGRPGIKSKDARSIFFYTAFGMQDIVEVVLGALGKNVTVLRAAQAVSCQPEENGVRVSFTDRTGSAKGTISARRLVSTIPVISLASILQAPELDKYLPHYRSRHLILLNLILQETCQLARVHWIYCPQGDIVFSRVFVPGVWSHQMVPDQGLSVSLEVICGDDLFRLPDRELLDRLLQDVGKVGMNFSRDNIRHAFLTRYENAYPVVLDRDMINEGKKLLRERFPFLRLAGRAGEHSYFDIEDCLCSVRAVAKELVGSGNA
ncbi:MAG: NAD(P)-binding protein [Candidatus Omnitrophica bacterium]|nr:NAD(P)-binding protein [Candidatus Omnitrophota bacterium]